MNSLKASNVFVVFVVWQINYYQLIIYNTLFIKTILHIACAFGISLWIKLVQLYGPYNIWLHTFEHAILGMPLSLSIFLSFTPFLLRLSTLNARVSVCAKICLWNSNALAIFRFVNVTHGVTAYIHSVYYSDSNEFMIRHKWVFYATFKSPFILKLPKKKIPEFLTATI